MTRKQVLALFDGGLSLLPTPRKYPLKATKRKWYLANRERILAVNRAWLVKNREAKNAKRRKSPSGEFETKLS